MPPKGGTQGDSGMGFFPSIYQSALAQSAEDYDSIMGQYKGLGGKASSGGGSNLTFNPISPELSEYQPGSSYDYLKDFVNTGGYSEGDVGNIRERAISPIRSIYASAQSGLNRQKRLSGGYSPNYGAVSSKMARDASSIIGDKTTDINAAIAEMVNRGKQFGASNLAPLEARETELRNQIERENTASINRANEFNTTTPLQFEMFREQNDNNDFDNILKTIQGQQSLFGTTPALASTIGNQTLSAANTVNNFAPIKRNTLATRRPMDFDTPVAGRNLRS